MTTALFDWPYAGLLLAIALLGALLFKPRPTGGAPPWRNAGWVLALLWPMYLFHQFEEHGIDAMGRHYAFLGELCSTLGYQPASSCPADPAFIFAVNAVACQIAFAMAWVLRTRRPLVSACAWGIPIVNAVTHIAAAVMHRSYNPGLVTSLVLFVPLSLLMLSTVLRTHTITVRNVSRVVASGVFVHAVLMASLLLRARALLSYEWFLTLNGVNGIAPLAFGTLGARRQEHDTAELSAPTSA